MKLPDSGFYCAEYIQRSCKEGYFNSELERQVIIITKDTVRSPAISDKVLDTYVERNIQFNMDTFFYRCTMLYPRTAVEQKTSSLIQIYWQKLTRTSFPVSSGKGLSYLNTTFQRRIPR